MLASSNAITSPTSTPQSGIASATSPTPLVTTSSLTQSSVGTNKNKLHNYKCESGLSPSPTTGVVEDEAAKTNNSTDSSVQQRESSVALNQSKSVKSNFAVNSTGGMMVHNTSPKSLHISNDNSNSSNSTVSQKTDADALPNNAAAQQQQQPNSNESNTKGTDKAIKKKGGVDDSSDANINANAPGTFNFSTASKENPARSTSTSSSSSSVCGKEDPELNTAGLGRLVNIKKEHPVEPPEISPDGFGSMSTLGGNSHPANIAGGSSGGNNNNIGGKSVNLTGAGCSGPPSSIGVGISGSINNLINESVSNGHQHQSVNKSVCRNEMNVPNVMDHLQQHMQQQNHIFVFSTQLANKGAESVLNGQFPTIIAYHCTQPATKKFLEDFFLKNPIKMAKMQRQNSLNMSIPMSSSPQWTPNSAAMQVKQLHKANGRIGMVTGAGGIVNNQMFSNNAMNDKCLTPTINSSPNTGFPDVSDTLSGAADLMNWEQSALENIANASNANASKIVEGLENIDSSQNGGSVNSSSSTLQQTLKSIDTASGRATVSPSDNLQPSLQGVKVPDENLTPQQRQHREEQLAKLKKMNQFLFPEHGELLHGDSSILQGPNRLGKLNADSLIGPNPSNSVGGMVGILNDSPGSSSLTGVNNQQINKGRGGPSSMGRNGVILETEESPGLPTGIIGGLGDMNVHCGNPLSSANNLLMNTQQDLSCGTGNSPLETNDIVGGGNTNDSNHNNLGGLNSINSCGASVAAASGMILQGCLPKGLNSSQQMDMLGAGPHSQMHWSKMQHQFYEEQRANGCKSGGGGGLAYVRTSQSGTSGISAVTCSTSGHNNRSQGPPPPYHPTQRSASVPIVTQSPNPSSPNNPTSNLSLPSPKTTNGSCGTMLNSPSSEALASASASSTPSATTSSIAVNSANSNQFKAFPQEDASSGSSGNIKTLCNNNVRNSKGQFNSNPGTPLSNMSPKEMESSGSPGGIIGGVKNPRPSPQRPKTPHTAGNNNSESIEGRFPPASPGNFPPLLPGQGNGAKIGSGGGADNQTSLQVLFGRRTDNLPLNPNSNRPSPSKQNLNFDPISSLAQMSQQLTSCVPSNGGISGPNNVGGISVSSDMAIGGPVYQNIDGGIGPLDGGGMDHCGNFQGNSVGMGIPSHLLMNGGQYASANCHNVNPLGPMTSRLLVPKGSGGNFGLGPSGIRHPDSLSGFHSGMPAHRFVGGRMGVNFCPFNGSPNIQVKASTPNTIQYMPARPQTNNTNPRVTPSFEFLQRFGNPQLSGCSNISDGPIGAGPEDNSDPNKISNNASISNINQAGMNFFQNCNQFGSASSPGGNQNDFPVGMMPGNSNIGGVMNIGGNPSSGVNIRGMRPLKQGNIGPSGSPVIGVHRMPGSGSHILSGSGGVNPFENNPHEALECINSDPNNIFSNAQNELNQLFIPQQKGSPMGGGGQAHCQNIPPANVGINGPLGANEHNSSIQSQMNAPGMLLSKSNSGIVNGKVPGSVSVTGSAANSAISSYKPYMAQSSNDLKYAQQYHNFQQQLYATSTRSHLSQQIGASQVLGSGINSVIPTNSNHGFFANK